MRVAVCVGGQLRVEPKVLKLTVDLLKDAFPTADMYYTVWREDYVERKDEVDQFGGHVEIIDEYDIDYHPYEDNRDAVNTHNYRKKLKFPNPTRHLHQTKQILNHNTMMRKYLHKYDVVVRSRYDVMLSPYQDYRKVLEECLNHPATITILDGERGNGYHIHSKVVYDNDSNPSRMVGDSGTFVHRVVDWDCDLVDRLHKEKKLLAAEFGWYQAICQYTEYKNYIIYSGASKLTRCHTPEERENFVI